MNLGGDREASHSLISKFFDVSAANEHSEPLILSHLCKMRGFCIWTWPDLMFCAAFFILASCPGESYLCGAPVTPGRLTPTCLLRVIAFCQVLWLSSKLSWQCAVHVQEGVCWCPPGLWTQLACVRGRLFLLWNWLRDSLDPVAD